MNAASVTLKVEVNTDVQIMNLIAVDLEGVVLVDHHIHVMYVCMYLNMMVCTGRPGGDRHLSAGSEQARSASHQTHQE